MNKEEVDRFLDSKLNLQIGTIDEEGDPNIQPVWFYYDKDREKLLIITPKVTKKVQNLRNRPNVYFSIDDGNFPYKGVKGKGIAAIVEDPRINVLQGEKIYMKYLETLEHPIAKMTLDSAQKGNHVVIEIDPKFFFTWDFAKMQDFESNFVIIKKYRIHCHHTSLLLLDLSNHGLLVHLVMVAVQSLLPQKFKQINNSYLLVKMNNRNPYTCRELVPSQAFYNSVF